MRIRIGICLALAVGPILVDAPAWAHPGLHHDIAKVTAAIEVSPDRPDLWLRRARLHRLDGHAEAALADLERARHLGMGDGELLLEQGLALADAGFGRQAEETLNLYLQGHPGNADARARLGQLYADRGEIGFAIDAFRQSVDVSCRIETVVALGRLLEKTQQLDAAADLYRDALPKLGDAVLIVGALIRVETARGVYESALELVDALIKKSPVSTEWRIERARILRQRGDDAAANLALVAALKEADQSVRRRRTAINLHQRARVYHLLDRRREAIADLDAALQLAPGYVPAMKLHDQLNSNHKIQRQD